MRRSEHNENEHNFFLFFFLATNNRFFFFPGSLTRRPNHLPHFDLSSLPSFLIQKYGKFVCLRKYVQRAGQRMEYGDCKSNAMSDFSLVSSLTLPIGSLPELSQ
jgi:hypothetical protein